MELPKDIYCIIGKFLKYEDMVNFCKVLEFYNSSEIWKFKLSSLFPENKIVAQEPPERAFLRHYINWLESQGRNFSVVNHYHFSKYAELLKTIMVSKFPRFIMETLDSEDLDSLEDGGQPITSFIGSRKPGDLVMIFDMSFGNRGTLQYFVYFYESSGKLRYSKSNSVSLPKKFLEVIKLNRWKIEDILEYYQLPQIWNEEIGYAFKRSFLRL